MQKENKYDKSGLTAFLSTFTLESLSRPSVYNGQLRTTKLFPYSTVNKMSSPHPGLHVREALTLQIPATVSVSSLFWSYIKVLHSITVQTLLPRDILTSFSGHILHSSAFSIKHQRWTYVDHCRGTSKYHWRGTSMRHGPPL